MSEHRYPPLHLAPRYSTVIRGVYLTLVTTTLGLLALLPMTAMVSVLLILATLLLARREWSRRPELGGPVPELVWRSDGTWLWRDAGAEEHVTLHGESVCWAYLVLLRFNRRAILLAPDSVDRESFRQLKLRLNGDPSLRKE